MTSVYASTPLDLGAMKHLFHFRPMSADERVIKQTFVGQQYDLRRFPRAAELMGFVDRRIASGGRPLIIDAGAKIGASAVYFAAVVPSAGSSLSSPIWRTLSC